MSATRARKILANETKLVVPSRWVETFVSHTGINIHQRDAGVGMSLRIPAVTTLHVSFGKRVCSLNVGGIAESDLEACLAAGTPITSAELPAMFGGLTKPDDENLQHLKTALNIMRVTVRAKDFPRLVLNRVKSDFSALLESMPLLVDLQKQDREFAPKSQGAVYHGQQIVSAFETVLNNTRQADKFIGKQAPKRKFPAWFSDALWLASYLRMVFETTHGEIGVTKPDSRGVLFIARALKRSCPTDRLTEDNIARTMARHSDLTSREFNSIEGV
jgi:hypothetical protein